MRCEYIYEDDDEGTSIPCFNPAVTQAAHLGVIQNVCEEHRPHEFATVKTREQVETETRISAMLCGFYNTMANRDMRIWQRLGMEQPRGICLLVGVFKR